MGINDFQLTVSEIAINLSDQEEGLTVEGILDYLDQKQNYDKKTYGLMYTRIYNALRDLQYKVWGIWHDYTASDKYETDLKAIEYYYQDETKEVWQNDYFRQIYDKGYFSKEQIEETIIKGKLFEKFIEDLKQRGLIFVVAGKGNKTYRIPDYHDFCVYKFNNVLSTANILDSQTTEFASDGLLLPRGISAKELDDLSERVVKALEFKQEE